MATCKIAAFGFTLKKGARPEDDTNIPALLSADTPVVTLVGKSWDLHVIEVLQTSLEENLAHDRDQYWHISSRLGKR